VLLLDIVQEAHKRKWSARRKMTICFVAGVLSFEYWLRNVSASEPKSRLPSRSGQTNQGTNQDLTQS